MEDRSDSELFLLWWSVSGFGCCNIDGESEASMWELDRLWPPCRGGLLSTAPFCIACPDAGGGIACCCRTSCFFSMNSFWIWFNLRACSSSAMRTRFSNSTFSFSCFSRVMRCCTSASSFERWRLSILVPYDFFARCIFFANSCSSCRISSVSAPASSPSAITSSFATASSAGPSGVAGGGCA